MTTDNITSFKQFGLKSSLLKALDNVGYETPSPIQAQTIPLLLENRDVLGQAQTGTGKTAAFLLPIIHNLHESKKGSPGLRALVVTPTRELALQVSDSMRTYSKNLPLRSTVVHGGVSANPQISSLRKKPDLLVATPGRLLQHLDQTSGEGGWQATWVCYQCGRSAHDVLLRVDVFSRAGQCVGWLTANVSACRA